MIVELIKDKIRVTYNGMQWMSEWYDEGGREARNPANGEMIVTKPKWVGVNGGCYNSRISDAINSCTKYHIFKENEGELLSIKDYVNALEATTKRVLNTLEFDVNWIKIKQDSGV